MDDLVLLYDSTFCRLCAEENDNGILLFATEENEQDLCSTINRYLPLKVNNLKTMIIIMVHNLISYHVCQNTF